MRVSELGSLFFLLIGCTVAAQGCAELVSARSAFSVCPPVDWYHRELVSGALFLCSRPDGKCTVSGGGMPMSGQATLSIVAAQKLRNGRPPGSLAEVARQVLRGGSADSMGKKHEKGEYSEIDYLAIERPFSLDGLNEVPKRQFFYFAEVDGRFFYVILTFNSGDSRARQYEKVAHDLLLSLRVSGG